MKSIFKQRRERASTGLINRVVREARQANQPRHKGIAARESTMTQAIPSRRPSLIKCNDSVTDPNWKRYLLGKLHAELPFPEVPIIVFPWSR
ncbi:MAG: hypothetical protein R3B90_06265 [Planctomycetaceae bacterium]